MTRIKRRDIDMTSGPILRNILIFVLPLIFTNLLQMLYNATDMIVVGLSSEPDAVGAIGTTTSFVSLIVSLFIGLSIGANVVVARHIGAKDEERASRALHTSTVIALIFGVVGAVIGVLIAKPVMVLMGNEGRLLELSVLYTRIYFAALPFHSLSNYAIALHRAKGDTKTPLAVLTVSGIVNVALNLFFVLVCDMSVEGVAIATAAAAALSAAVLYANLMREKGPCHFSFRQLCLDRTETKQILLVGIPSGVQGALFALSNMMIQSSIIQVNNAMCDPSAPYQPVVKGNAAVANLEGFVYTAVNAVTQATISFTSQNLGAAKYDRIKRVMISSYVLDFGIAVVLSALLALFNRPLLALYGVYPDAADPIAQLAYDSAVTRILWTILPYGLISMMEIGSGVMRGLGKTISSTVVCLLGACFLRVLWVNTVFRSFGTMETIFIVYPLSWVITGGVLFLLAAVALRRLRRDQLGTINEL